MNTDWRVLSGIAIVVIVAIVVLGYAMGWFDGTPVGVSPAPPPAR
jgi:hypothetical protein